jgi:hypothetical protein
VAKYSLRLAGEKSCHTSWGVPRVVEGVNIWTSVDVKLGHVNTTRGRGHGAAAAYAAEESRLFDGGKFCEVRVERKNVRFASTTVVHPLGVRPFTGMRDFQSLRQGVVAVDGAGKSRTEGVDGGACRRWLKLSWAMRYGMELGTDVSRQLGGCHQWYRRQFGKNT